MIDLESELNCAGDPGATFKALVAVGADPAAIVGWPIYGAIGYSPIRTSGDLFEIADHGRGAVLVGVRDDDSGKLIDAVAFDPERPSKFWRRTGAAVFLGWDHVDRAGFFGEPLTLYPHPLAWLQAGCDGAVWLDFTRSLTFWTATIPTIRAATPAFGHALDKRLKQERAMPWPRVHIPRNAEAA